MSTITVNSSYHDTGSISFDIHNVEEDRQIANDPKSVKFITLYSDNYHFVIDIELVDKILALYNLKRPV